MKKPIFLSLLLAAAFQTSVSGASLYWNGAGTTWNTAANWSSSADGSTAGSAPTAADDVIFNTSSVVSSQTINFSGANRAARSLTFVSPGEVTLLTGETSARTLLLGAGGITVQAGAGPATIGNGQSSGVPVRFLGDGSGNQTWTNNSSNLLWVRNSVSAQESVTTPVNLIIAGSGNTTIVGALNDGAGGSVVSLTKTGSGVLDRTSTNISTYSGGTTINDGVLVINNNNQLGATAGGITFGGGTLRTTAAINNSTRAVTINSGGGTIDVVGDVTWNQTTAITGTGRLTKTGTGTLILANVVNTFSGGLTINEGIVQAGLNDRLGQTGSLLTLNGGTFRASGTYTILAGERPIEITSAGGAIDVTSGATLRFEDTLSGAGKLTKTGAGTLYLVGGKTYQGGTALNGGTVLVFDDNRLGVASSALSFDGGTLRANGGFTMNRATTLNAGGGTISVDAGFTVSQQGVISGTGDLTKSGDGTFVVSSNSNYSGTTRVAGGVMRVTGAINSSTALAVSGGTFQFGANNIVSDTAAVTLGDGGILATANFSDSLGVLAVTGNATIDLTGQSVLRFAGSSATIWTGSLTVYSWDGSPAGGGAEGLFFGTSADGVSADQLSRIFLVNPEGYEAGTYTAAILATGEIVVGSIIPEVSASMLALLSGVCFLGRRRR